LDASARLLRLLSLLQSRRDWSGAELAQRLEVGLRTLRRDIDRLRELGYPVDAVPGPAGGYRLGPGAALPPLLLDDDEAVAVVLSLRTAAAGSSIAGLDEVALAALAKIKQVLPARLARRVADFQLAAVPLAGTVGESVDADLLTELAAACRDCRQVRMRYVTRGQTPIERTVEPYRLVHTPLRWYLLAWDRDKRDWRTFRVDRIEPPVTPFGGRFVPRELPPGGAAAFVSSAISTQPYPYQARILFRAPAGALAGRTSPAAGRLEPVDDKTCVFHTGSTSLEELALYIAVKGFDFEVLDPPELVPVLREVAGRLLAAAASHPVGFQNGT
jgi:predicted DNA-binding transcriptional regulator YafY